MPDIAVVSVFSASSRRSVLKTLNSVSSAVKPVSALAFASAAASVPAPSAKPAASLPLSRSIAASKAERSPVKSCGTRSDVESVVMATASAGASRFST